MCEGFKKKESGKLPALLQSWTKGCKQIHKIKQHRFFYGMLNSWFFCDFFYKKNVKIWLLDGRRGTLHQIQAFQVFS